jgi:putative phosphoribosyl transferase
MCPYIPFQLFWNVASFYVRLSWLYLSTIIRGAAMFKDRVDAAKLLAQQLLEYKDKPETIVLGLPRGGVVTAYEVAQILRLPLDIVVPRKIGAPQNQELAVAAIAEDGSLIINDQLMNYLGLQLDDLQNLIEKEKQESARRMKLYRAGRPPLELAGKTVILVDDGMATGATMRAALMSARSRGAKSIIVAVPVAPAEVLDEIRTEVDVLMCLSSPEQFFGVGGFYEHFPQVQDQEVIDLMQKSLKP